MQNLGDCWVSNRHCGKIPTTILVNKIRMIHLSPDPSRTVKEREKNKQKVAVGQLAIQYICLAFEARLLLWICTIVLEYEVR